MDDSICRVCRHKESCTLIAPGGIVEKLQNLAVRKKYHLDVVDLSQTAPEDKRARRRLFVSIAHTLLEEEHSAGVVLRVYTAQDRVGRFNSGDCYVLALFTCSMANALRVSYGKAQQYSLGWNQKGEIEATATDLAAALHASRTGILRIHVRGNLVVAVRVDRLVHI